MKLTSMKISVLILELKTFLILIIKLLALVYLHADEILHYLCIINFNKHEIFKQTFIIMQLPFGEWLPDQPKFMNPGANIAKNVYYAARSYKPFPSLIAYSASAGGSSPAAAGGSTSRSSTRATERDASASERACCRRCPTPPIRAQPPMPGECRC